MYCITDEQIAYIISDIRRNGVEMEDLQLNLLDHICCKVEQEFKENDDFERFYREAVKQLCRDGLYEIEEETINLLKFKNYYVMKKAMMISGTTSAVALIFGSFFKVMYWPGASVLLCLGILVLALVFLPLMGILKTRETAGAGNKITVVSGSILGLLFCIAVIAAVQHLPGARSGMYWLIAIGFSMFVFIPLYFFNGIRKPERRINVIVTTILLVGITCLQFTMVGLRRPVPQLSIYTYVKNEQILRDMQHQAVADTSPESRKLVAGINKDCEELKSIILFKDINETSIPDDFEQRDLVIHERMIDFRTTGKAYQLLTSIRESVKLYNASKTSTDSKIPTDHTILNIAPASLGFTTNLFVLNSLTQLQMSLAVSDHGKETQRVAVVN